MSIILATYNWPAALDLSLKSLILQTDQNFEVVIADDGSQEDTGNLIARWQTQASFPIKHLWQEDQGFRKSKILNQAILAAEGDYLIFLDGDCLTQPDFVARHRRLRKPGFMITGARVLLGKRLTEELCHSATWVWPLFKRQSLLHRFRGQLNKWLPLWVKLGTGAWRDSRRFIWRRIKGCNMSAWRQDVLRVGGFDEDFEGWGHEDADFVFRLYRAGIHRISGSWATEVLHLFHQSNQDPRALQNAAKIRERMMSDRMYFLNPLLLPQTRAWPTD